MVESALEKLRAVELDKGTALVLDLFGNVSFRFEQFDGSSSLPLKSQSGYHLPGEIIACGDSFFAKIVDIVMPLLTVLPGLMQVLVHRLLHGPPA